MSKIIFFQSVLQQASSLMSQGDDHLLSTIQVSFLQVYKYFLTSVRNIFLHQ